MMKSQISNLKSKIHILNPKTIFRIALLIIVILLNSGCSAKQPNDKQFIGVRSAEEYAVLQIDFGDDRIITNYELLITNYEDQYLWPAMKRVLEENNVYVDYQDYGGDLGVFIKQIEDKKNGQDGRYWQYLINGEYAKAGVSNYKMQAGDVILWKFSNYEL